MATARPSFTKRQRENAKRERQIAKAEKRAARKAAGDSGTAIDDVVVMEEVTAEATDGNES